MKVLVTGGSGYVGRFLMQHLCQNHMVMYTYCTNKIEDGDCAVIRGLHVNYEDGSGMQACLMEMPDIDVIVNCAAMSNPKECEGNKEMARRINVPRHLLDALLEKYPMESEQPLLIHLSTDQVYDGNKANWEVSDFCRPVNYYGVTKLEAEDVIKERWGNYVILRSSMIYGPRYQGQTGNRFLDFIVENMHAGNQTAFFSDEFRCFVYILDIVKIIEFFLLQTDKLQWVLNMGGPDRLSRVDMAREVARHFGVSSDFIEECKSADLVRAVPSPLDISMDSSVLQGIIPFPLTPLSAALMHIFPNPN